MLLDVLLLDAAGNASSWEHYVVMLSSNALLQKGTAKNASSHVGRRNSQSLTVKNVNFVPF